MQRWLSEQNNFDRALPDQEYHIRWILVHQFQQCMCVGDLQGKALYFNINVLMFEGVCVCLHIYIHMCMRMFVCVCVCVCGCVRVCVHARVFANPLKWSAGTLL